MVWISSAERAFGRWW